MDGQIRLRWTTHQGTILSVFDALLSSESLVDVTLACEGQYIRAHKIILSACSPYFQELLGVDASKHPIFFLKDVKYNELKALIQYMYRGEVNIAQEDLTSLLGVAQALKIRGLADVDTADKSVTSNTIVLPGIAHRTRQETIPYPSSPSSASTANFNDNVSLDSEQAQAHPFSQPPQLNQSSSDITSLSFPPTAPPPPKKSRMETPRKSSISLQKHPNSNSTQLDPLGPETKATSYSRHEDSVRMRPNGDFLNETTEQAEAYDTYSQVKAEEISEVGLVDLDENLTSQSSFSEYWQQHEGDTSGMMTDGDGQIPGSSCTNNEGESSCDAEGNEDFVTCGGCGKKFRNRIHPMHSGFDCPAVPPKFKCSIPPCEFITRRKYKLKLHLLHTHSLNVIA